MTTNVVCTARVQFRDYEEQQVTYDEVFFVDTTLVFKLQDDLVFAVNRDEFRSLTLISTEEFESDEE